MVLGSQLALKDCLSLGEKWGVGRWGKGLSRCWVSVGCIPLELWLRSRAGDTRQGLCSPGSRGQSLSPAVVSEAGATG